MLIFYHLIFLLVFWCNLQRYLIAQFVFSHSIYICSLYISYEWTKWQWALSIILFKLFRLKSLNNGNIVHNDDDKSDSKEDEDDTETDEDCGGMNIVDTAGKEKENKNDKKNKQKQIVDQTPYIWVCFVFILFVCKVVCV